MHATISKRAISMTTESNNSHFYGKDLVRIEEEVNMEAYVLCKNIISFEHILLDIALYRKIKAESLQEKKKLACFPELVITKTIISVRLPLKQMSRNTTEPRDCNKYNKNLSKVC